MLSHVTIGTRDVARALVFYRPLMSALGLVLKFSDSRWAGWMHPHQARPLFIVTQPLDGGAAEPGNGPMIAFLVDTQPVVDACHTLALRNGATDEGKPGLRPEYHPDYYGAYFRDLDGNKLCVCCHDPAPTEPAGRAFAGGETPA